MFAENGIEVDFEALNQVLQRADVLTIGFALFPQRLLVDTRVAGDEGPMVAIVEPVASVQGRFHWLGRRRPAFGAPKAFSYFLWPHTVRRLVEEDALAPLRARLAGVSNDGAATLEEAFAALSSLEREATIAAIRGQEPWRTIWEARTGR
ncbi:MAG: hypothetical protein HS107_13355 [Thermoflexaceae bacterium]|nr:hypothetical protein [Thermoflexaceae bacterium]